VGYQYEDKGVSGQPKSQCYRRDEKKPGRKSIGKGEKTTAAIKGEKVVRTAVKMRKAIPPKGDAGRAESTTYDGGRCPD